MRPRRRVETCQEYLLAQRNGKKLHSIRLLPAASTIQPEEREFVVDSGASIHMVTEKDLNSSRLETMRTSKDPTTVVTANGEVPTKEEATVYVRELDLFVTIMVLEDTAAVLSIAKNCEDHGFYYHWTIRCPWSVDKSFNFIFTYFSYIFIAGHRDAHGASSNNKKWECEWGKPAETENHIKMTTTWMHKETRRMICQNGCRSSGTVW